MYLFCLQQRPPLFYFEAKKNPNTLWFHTLTTLYWKTVLWRLPKTLSKKPLYCNVTAAVKIKSPQSSLNFCQFYVKHSLSVPPMFSPHLWFCSKVPFSEKHPVKLGTKESQRIRTQKRCNLLTNFAQCYLLTTQRKCCLFKTHFRTLFTESEWTNGPMSQAVVTSPMRLADCCRAWNGVIPMPGTTRHLCKQLFVRVLSLEGCVPMIWVSAE